ncbi:putative inorganic phosphate cotransporter isoform X3 [Nilaparvata lugens]|uniref:putative inorganic phosphate cotransporter isoform X3 n=1 Tax=Nilaparvata lugens TaxID=108931 RepID=UPI000B98CAE5|nr:putative inorganic phosphate cotransporter isoform X3 [Nilaparvata lugens]
MAATNSLEPLPKTQDNCCMKQRYVLGIMGFLALANGYIQRFCLSLAITEMVNVHHKGKIDPNSCPYDNAETSANFTKKYLSSAEFDWEEQTQGMILSAFFWGYVLTQLPGGLLAERVGGKQVLGLGLLISTICTLITPLAAHQGASYLIVTRFILGLGQGPLYPSLNVMLAQWAPVQERGRLGALVFAGAQIGNVISMAVGGLLIRYMGGWTSVFYVFGTSGLIWFFLWQFLCYSDPSSHPFISQSEKEFLLSKSVGQLKKRAELPPTPWRSIMTSVPLWGLIIAQIGHDWGLFTIITDLPKYMKSVMHFSIAQNGFLSAAPYMVMWIAAITSGWIVDWLINVKQYPVTCVRKTFITIASVGPAFGILAATYAGCDKVLVATFFTVGMGLMGAFVPSLKVNALDLSPNYAGTTLALVGGIGAISGIITPYLVGVLTPNSTLLEWRLVFWIAVIVLVATNLVYLFTGSGEVQPWNNPLEMEESNAKKRTCSDSQTKDDVSKMKSRM